MPNSNLKRKPRAKAMLDGIRLLITLRATSSSTKREELAREILEAIKREYPKEIPPAEETIIKMISNARRHREDPLSKPWHLGEISNLRALGVPDISAEAVKHIRDVQFAISEDDLPATITIRQAKWISILYREITDNRRLYDIATLYSHYELACLATNKPIDTFDLDMVIRNRKRLSHFTQRFWGKISPETLVSMLELGPYKDGEVFNAWVNHKTLK